MKRLPKPKEIAHDIIDWFDPNSSPRPLSECIEESLRKSSKKSSLSLHDDELIVYADEVKEDVRYHIDRYIKRCMEKHVEPKLKWSQSDPDRLIGRCYILKSDSPDIVDKKKRLRYFEQIRGVLCNELTDDEFRKLCALWIKYEFQCKKVQITDRPYDKGVDIIGISGNVSVLSQVKHIRCPNKQVPTNEIWAFIGKLSSLWRGIEKRRACFFTSSRFGLSKDILGTGLELIDGDMLAQFIVNHKLGFVTNANGEVHFSPEKLRQDLKTKI